MLESKKEDRYVLKPAKTFKFAQNTCVGQVLPMQFLLYFRRRVEIIYWVFSHIPPFCLFLGSELFRFSGSSLSTDIALKRRMNDFIRSLSPEIMRKSSYSDLLLTMFWQLSSIPRQFSKNVATSDWIWTNGSWELSWQKSIMTLFNFSWVKFLDFTVVKVAQPCCSESRASAIWRLCCLQVHNNVVDLKGAQPPARACPPTRACLLVSAYALCADACAQGCQLPWLRDQGRGWQEGRRHSWWSTTMMGEKDSREDIAKLLVMFNNDFTHKISFRNLARVAKELG